MSSIPETSTDKPNSHQTRRSQHRPLLFLGKDVNWQELIANIPDLLSHQRGAYKEFLQIDSTPSKRLNKGLHAMLSSVFPVKGKNMSGVCILEYDSYEIRNPICTVQHAYRNRMTYACPLYAKFRLSSWDFSETVCQNITEEDICLGNIPYPTPKGTFVISGVERVVVSQAHRSSGMFFDRAKGKAEDYRSFIGRIIPHKGVWVDIESDSKNVLYIRIDRKKMLATNLLMALDDDQTWEKRQSQTTDLRTARGFSKQDILAKVYDSFNAKKHTDGRWHIEFKPSMWENVVLRHEVFDCEGNLIGATGAKLIPKRIPAKILVPAEALCKLFLARDIVKSNGVVIAEAGKHIDLDLLGAHEELHIVAVRDSHPTAALCNTVAAEKCVTRWDAIAEVTKALRPGESLLPQIADNYIRDIFFNPNRYDLAEIGRIKVNERTGDNCTERTLRREDFFALIRVLLKIRDGKEDFDDVDSLRNRRIRGVDELLEAHCRQNIVKMAMSARDRIIAAVPGDSDALTPSAVLLTKPVVIAFREFFSSSQLSQLGDACNPLSGVAHGNRFSAMGPGGLVREYASFEVRDVHASHYGRICPIETPEGASVGLINSGALCARINNYGFIESQYRVIKNGVPSDETQFLTYSSERDKIIAPFMFVPKGEPIPGDLVACRCNGDTVKVHPQEIQFMDISPFQSISISASLVPYLAHNDPLRVLMGANMQRQALPLINPEAPHVCTGSESAVVTDSNAVICARNTGTVLQVDHTLIIVKPNDPLQPNDRYDLMRFVKSNASTFMHQTPIRTLKVGDVVKKGEVIVDCAASSLGEISLGKNVLVAFMPWYGYNFEDAVVVSDRLVDEDVFTSIHINHYDAIAHDTKTGEEIFTKDIPNISPRLLAKLDENGIIRIGAEVQAGDILVGKVIPKVETNVAPEEKLLRSIFGDKAADVHDLSLRVPAGVKGVVTDVQIISRRGYMDDTEIAAVVRREREQILTLQTTELNLWYSTLYERLDLQATLSFKEAKSRDTIKQVLQIFSKNYEALIKNTDAPINNKSKDIIERVLQTLEKYCDKPDNATKKRKITETSYQDLDGHDDTKETDGSIENISELLEWNNLINLPAQLFIQLPLQDSAGRIELFQKELQDIKTAHEKQLQELTSAYKAGSDGLHPGVMRSVRIFVASKRRIQAGDKVAGRHGNKCIVSTVASRADMPYMEDGTPIDIILNPLGVPSRMNLGQIFELVTGMISRSLQEKFTEAYKTENLTELRRLLTKTQNRDLTQVSDQEILESASQIVNHGLGLLAMPFCSPTHEAIDDFVDFLKLPPTCKFKLRDGRTGDPMLHPVAVGSMYIMRLNHDVDDKAHARSIGPYALINQQPLGGKAQSGGQRVGEMEVWALQASGAAYTLLEVLTVKSDDIQGRLQAYDSFVRGDDRFSVNTPESFKIFCLYARALCLNIRYKDDQEEDFIPGISDYSISTRLSDIELKFSIASPDEILGWSYGTVESPETNYHRNDRPVQKGLFCARIFGPVVNYECNCGKYKRMKYNGIVCEKCEVEVTHSRVRRERMGHIALATPVTHIWFTHVLPSRIGALLGMNLRTIESILSCEAYVITNPAETDYHYGQIISANEYDKLQEKLDSDDDSIVTFMAETGGAAIASMLKAIDLEEESLILKQELAVCTAEAKRKKISKKLELVQHLIASGTRPEWMTVTVLPVLPPDLRPVVMIDDSYGRSGSVGVNDLYKTILNRNNRLKTFMRINAPLEIMRNEIRAIQQAVDTLFDNGRNGSVVSDNGGRRYRSLSSCVKGKQGICRQDLLGKRVDYSGRSVIVVGPELRLDQCGLPRKMALELFKPFVMAKLESYGFASTLGAARKLVEQEAPEIWDILADVIRSRPVLLNRAPTLHRLGIQAFNPILVEGKAIKLHPLVCAAFNADFDGDQMSVHVPLSVEARLEAHFIMLSTKNLLSPASGAVVVAPSQDVVLGIYELTHTYDSAPIVKRVFSSFNEVAREVDLDQIHLQAKIKVFHKGELLSTTPGRIILYQICPDTMDFSIVNCTLKKKDIGRILYDFHKLYGAESMARFVDDMKDLGFYWATRAGLTVGKNDFVEIESARSHIQEATVAVQDYESQQHEGLLTQSELASKSVDMWSKCTEDIERDMMTEISKPTKDGLNPLIKMIDSSARASPSQLRQMIGIRGLIVRSDNSIMLIPVTSNYYRGLNSNDLFNCTYGTRKGSTDTALKTSNAGHLSRKLVEACQSCVITGLDCKTTQGIKSIATVDENGERTDMYALSKGRILCEDILDPKTGNILLPRNTLVLDEHEPIFQKNIINQIILRSPVKCELRNGVCAYCYGLDLSKGRLVSLGETVGITAAQSIGEPGAQLTLDTFHSGGVAQLASTRSSITFYAPGIVRFSGRLIQNNNKENIVFARTAELAVENEFGVEVSRHRVPYGATLMIQDGQKVSVGTLAAQWDPYNNPIITEHRGVVRFHDIMEGVSLVKETDELTGTISCTIIDWKCIAPTSFQPKIEVVDPQSERSFMFTLAAGTVLEVVDGQEVGSGQILAKIPKASLVSQDITGGLHRISELLEACQNPKTQAILSGIDGYVEYNGESRGRYKLVVKSRLENLQKEDLDNKSPTKKNQAKSSKNEFGEEQREYLIPQYRVAIVQTGDFVRKGEPLTDGVLSANCILRILGIDALVLYMTEEIQKVYRLQGASISSKHFEIVLRQMLQKQEVLEPGDSTFMAGNYIDNFELIDANAALIAQGKKPITSRLILMGITNSAIHGRSALSSVSFQNSVRTFIKESIAGTESKVSSPKDYVITAILMSAGTGFVLRNWLRRFREIRAQQLQQAAIASST